MSCIKKKTHLTPTTFNASLLASRISFFTAFNWQPNFEPNGIAALASSGGTKRIKSLIIKSQK